MKATSPLPSSSKTRKPISAPARMGAVCCRCCFFHGSGLLARPRFDWGRVCRFPQTRPGCPPACRACVRCLDPSAAAKRQGRAEAKRDGAEFEDHHQHAGGTPQVEQFRFPPQTGGRCRSRRRKTPDHQPQQGPFPPLRDSEPFWEVQPESLRFTYVATAAVLWEVHKRLVSIGADHGFHEN